MNDIFLKVDNEKFIDFLYKLINSRIPWIQRKEVSAWSALLFLYAILWAINSIIKSKNSIIASPIESFFLLGLIYAICFIFFRFIHSQYASIYYMTAHSNVIAKFIFISVEKDKSFFEIKKISNYEDFQELIKENVNSELQNKVQQFRGNIHPLKIVFYLWVPFIYKIFHQNKIKLCTHEKAEASIYSLIIISIIISSWKLLI